MAITNFFMHRIKRSTDGTFDKGIEVKETYEAAKQSYHAYLGAYAYGQNASTDYVQCEITDATGTTMMKETWMAPEEEEEEAAE